MLGYRSTFAIDMDRTDTPDRDHVVMSVLGEGFTWLRTQKGDRDVDSVEPGTLTTLASGREVVYLHETQTSGSEYARLVAMDPPEADGQRWVTSLLVGIDHGKDRRGPGSWPMVGVEIDAPVDTGDPPRTLWTSRPKLVQNILGAYICDDHGFTMGDGPRDIDVDHVDELLDQLREKDHHGLVILCAEDGTVPRAVWTDRLARITRETLGQASVFLLSEDALHAFNGAVSPAHALVPYSPRTFRPGAVLDDPSDAHRHRFLSMKTLLGERIDDLTRSFGRASREHANKRPLDHQLRRLEEISSIRLDEVTRTSSLGSHVSATASTPRGVGRAKPSLRVRTPGRVDELHPTVVPEDANSSAPLVGRPPANHTPHAAPDVDEIARPQTAPPVEDVEDVEASGDLREVVGQLEARLTALEASLEEREAELRVARSEIERTRAEAEQRAIRARENSEKLHQDLRDQLEDEQLERALLDDDMRKTERELRKVQLQLDSARELMARNDVSDTVSWIEPEEDPYGEPVDSWEDLQTYAELEVFDHLRFVGDWDDARDLADHDATGTWVHSTWDALAMLNDYAKWRTSENSPVDGGLREFIGGRAPAGAHLIPAGRVHFNESETVRHNKDWMRERTCCVPPDIDPCGRLEMVAHVEIQTRGSVSPRLYFADRTADLGQVIIGRIGSHPTNTRTN